MRDRQLYSKAELEELLDNRAFKVFCQEVEGLRPSLRDIQSMEIYCFRDGFHRGIDKVFGVIEDFKKSWKSVPPYEQAEGQIEEVEDNG